jgi:hypothetical protein
MVPVSLCLDGTIGGKGRARDAGEGRAPRRPSVGGYPKTRKRSPNTSDSTVSTFK